MLMVDLKVVMMEKSNYKLDVRWLLEMEAV